MIIRFLNYYKKTPIHFKNRYLTKHENNIANLFPTVNTHISNYMSSISRFYFFNILNIFLNLTAKLKNKNNFHS